MLVIKKIKSFTIAEMIVVLVLSAIVISIAILVLNMVQSQIFGIQHNLKKQAEVQLLERSLWQDFNRFDLDYDKKNEVLFCFTPLDTVKYIFRKDYICRNKDTIRVSVQNIKFYSDARQVLDGRLDALELRLSEGFQEKELFVFQNKGASYYMNFN